MTADNTSLFVAKAASLLIFLYLHVRYSFSKFNNNKQDNSRENLFLDCIDGCRYILVQVRILIVKLIVIF